MPTEPHVFATTIERQDTGIITHVVVIPPEVAEACIAVGHRRVIVLLNGTELRRSIFSTRDGEFGLVIGRTYVRDLKLAVGEPMVVEMWPDPEPDRVDLCDELIAALEQDPEAAERFYNWTPGKQRSLAVHVCGAKRPATREKRAVEICYKLRTYTLAGDRKTDA
ncbi:MAG: YdeI/OmpD-associated family protein [Rhodothermales bacterium]|nr:YdeI/OmpD-associated family protein [Rhodothermales bacterium]MBO6779350.1 YdeI/OmpD-associated family protein [Rhodothermales bacterium]